MARLRYGREELLRSHDYARPQIEAGHRLHGGFDASGRYVPPRALVREPALDAWTEALRARGGDLLAADSSLLAGVRYPSDAQQKLLIREGLGQTFWNSLTIIGLIEARGRVLADMVFPELEDAVVQDVSEMAVGHLNRGLLRAHGLDEGGEPEKGIGGHDVMWFALRDLAFGRTDFPVPRVPENIARPDANVPAFPDLPIQYERLVYFLLNLLMIELRAERGFSSTERLLRDPELFRTRRAEAEHAAEIVNRIRADEAVHVHSLRLYLGELRALDFKTRDGSTRPGREIVDTLWEGIVKWATVEQPPLAAAQQKELLLERIAAHPEAERVRREFLALEER
ncbi:MAG TPA: hypothetical protein VMW35_22175 [Myxococcota bacterium]|jgi:hypothetical protein|nr:hypothetical protein [Myxococcota bacterium]